MRGVPVTLVLALLGCGAQTSRPLIYGSDECAHCHMTLIDPRYAAVLVTRTGRTIPFDDIGCLARYVSTGEVDVSQARAIRVADYLTPEAALLELEEAVLLASDRVTTPMGYGVVATGVGRGADSLAAALAADRLTWPELVARLRGPGG